MFDFTYHDGGDATVQVVAWLAVSGSSVDADVDNVINETGQQQAVVTVTETLPGLKVSPFYQALCPGKEQNLDDTLSRSLFEMRKEVETTWSEEDGGVSEMVYVNGHLSEFKWGQSPIEVIVDGVRFVLFRWKLDPPFLPVQSAKPDQSALGRNRDDKGDDDSIGAVI